MRRFVVLVVLVLFAVPFGASLSGCSKKDVTQFCNGGDSGPVVGQVKSITLSPSFATFGESLDYGQIGSGLSASAQDCKGSAVSVRSYVYATSDMSFADINPNTGQVCGGTYNRNTGGGVPDYTTCTPPVNPPANRVAYVTATAEGTVSNAIPVYIHPVVTSVVIGSPTATASCSTTSDPSTNCCPAYTAGAVVSAPAYVGGSCLSQGVSAQLTARVYKNGTTNPADNITCQVGHVNYASQNGSIFTVDQNGVATAQQPGSTIVTANVTNSGTGGAAGFFATCPPASITLTATNQPAGPISVGVNNSQPLTAVVVDTNGVTLSGTTLQYVSTTPSTIQGSSNVTPQFPGSATITAICQPPSCNPAPFSQIGLYGTGKPITSNGVQVNANGTNATVLYIASTQSQYLLPVDFSTGQQGSLLKLTYVPNSMVISQDGSTIYLGSTTALMTVSAGSNSLTGTNVSVPGTVLAVSPDGGTVVVTDPVRQTVSLVANGSVSSTYGGVGLRAQFSPDSQTVYIAAASNQLLVHSVFTGWYATTSTAQYADIAVTVPHAGAFFASNTITEGRTYCSTSTQTSTGNPPVENNVYYPVAGGQAVKTDRIAATNDGVHILGATASTTPATLDDITYSVVAPMTTTQPGGPVACTTATGPVTFTTAVAPHVLTAVAATSITGVYPASNSAVAFVTYTGTGGVLPLYIPATGVTGNVALTSGAVAPVNGVFSSDNKTFYAGTSGDNQVHLITVNGTTAADSTTPITPKLPDANGNFVVPNLLVQRPKRSTS